MEPTTSEDTNICPSTSSATASVSTRRTAVFRPPTRTISSPSSFPGSSIDMESQNLSGNGESMQQDDSKVSTNKKVPWSLEEVCAFYEAIKAHGKDFDSIVKILEKKKIEKTKDQVKTFFFNSAKAYRQMLSLTEEELTNVPRDARELFLMVNACEWKKKTINMRVNVEKLRELIFEGVSVVKVGRKLITIKTPPCPALCKYFSCRKAERIPADVFIHLEPTSNGDHVYMRNRNYNPYLRIKMNVNDRITKLLEFVQKKWTDGEENIQVTLWPDSACEVATLVVHTVETSPFIAVSMNKLKKHTEDMKERMEPKKPPTILQLAGEVNTRPKPTHDVYFPRPFVLTDQIVAEGLTLQNVKTAIIAELFCVCGRKNPIQLRYEIKSNQQKESSTVEPWKTMIDLLKRGYGDSLTSSKKEDARDLRRELKVYEAVEPSVKRKKTVEEHQTIEEPIPNPVSDIVRQENEEFESQIAMLRKTQRQKSIPVKRKNTTNPVLSTGTPRISVHPAKKQVFTAPTCTMVPRKAPGKQGTLRGPTKMETMKPGSSTYSEETNLSAPRRPTDFSSVVFSPAKKMHGQVSNELQRKQAHEFLSTIRADNPVVTEKKVDAHAMFGDISMSPGSTRHASLMGAQEGKDTSVIDFTEMMFQHLDNNTDTVASNPNLDFSVSEVQQTYNDLLSSQNSQDFLCQHFPKKTSHQKAPKKK